MHLFAAVVITITISATAGCPIIDKGSQAQLTLLVALEAIICQSASRIIFYRAMLRSQAQLCHSMSSVCLSVTFKYADHIGWNTSKIISRLISSNVLARARDNPT